MNLRQSVKEIKIFPAGFSMQLRPYMGSCQHMIKDEHSSPLLASLKRSFGSLKRKGSYNKTQLGLQGLELRITDLPLPLKSTLKLSGNNTLVHQSASTLKTRRNLTFYPVLRHVRTKAPKTEDCAFIFELEDLKYIMMYKFPFPLTQKRDLHYLVKKALAFGS